MRYQRTPPCSFSTHRFALKRNARKRRSAGLSLIEVLISLAIVAMLLTATGAAFDAALRSYKVNHDIATVSVAARNALYQMTTNIRSAWNLDPVNFPDDAIYVDATSCSFRDAGDRVITYTYDATDSRLLVTIVNSGSTTTRGPYTMVDDVFPVSLGQPIFTVTLTGDGRVGRVEIRFMVAIDGVSRTVSASAVPRNILYSL